MRTLAIVVTLACVYFGGWQATKHWGIPQIRASLNATGNVETVEAPLPFLVRAVGFRNEGGTASGKFWNVEEHYTRYSLWLFGLTIELPFGHTETSTDHGATYP